MFFPSFLISISRLVCDCLEKTKDDYKYFSIGHNGHCLGSMSFHGNRRNNEAGCINAGEHSAGLANHEYVYQIKADAATRKTTNRNIEKAYFSFNTKFKKQSFKKKPYGFFLISFALLFASKNACKEK